MFTCGPAFFQSASSAQANDPYFSNVELLMHFDGADQQNTTVDSSSRARAITNNALMKLRTDAAKFGASSTESGGNFGWTTVDNDAWNFGAGTFTVELWVYFTSLPATGNNWSFVSQWSGSTDLAWRFGMAQGGLLSFNIASGGTGTTHSAGAAWTPALNTWYHVAADRDGSNTLRVYLNGAVHASAAAAVTIRNSALPLDIAGSRNGFAGITGRIDEVRITKGVARYAGAFTPPTAAFPNS